MTLKERIDAASPDELREMIYNAWLASGWTQSQLYKRIRECEERVREQRLEINRLLAAAADDRTAVPHDQREPEPFNRG